ncbi:MAG: PilZ domain-containing protein [Treponema sp.]|nr:PilZ domain-containing protein [Treponema sp.]
MNMFPKRQKRFNDIGKIEAPGLCALPGMLVNISKEGCKVRFPLSVAVDLENDYELTVFPTCVKSATDKFTVLCKPCWHKKCKGSTEIGFNILRCPEYHHVISYVSKLESSFQSLESSVVGMVCNFA